MLVATFSPISNQALACEELPTRLKVLNFGTNQTLDEPIVVNRKTAKHLKDVQAKTGGDTVQIDFDHNTVPGSKAYAADKEPRAVAGYGNPVMDDNGDIWLENIKWTDHGKQYAKDYHDLSPAVILDEHNTVVGLHSVALTPKGAIKDLTFYSAENVLKERIVKAASADSTDTSDMEIKQAKDFHGLSADEMMDGDDDFDKDVHKKHLQEYDQEDHFSKYGDVDYADKENHKYPVDTEAHVRAAWSYINMPKNAKKYSGDKLSQIKSNIKSAMKRHGIEADEEKTKTKTNSADFTMPDAYENTLPNEVRQARKNMYETFKALNPKFGMLTDAEIQQIFDFVKPRWKGEEDGVEGPITNKENSPHPAWDGKKLSEFSAKLKQYEDRVLALEALSEAEKARHLTWEKDQILAQATKDGKVLPPQSVVKALSASELKELTDSLQKQVVPLRQTMKILSTTGNMKPKVTMADISNILDAVVNTHKSPTRI